MDANKGILFQGHKIQISDDNGTTWNDIGCMTNFTWDQPERPKIDTTCSSDNTRTYRFGLRDVGSVSFDSFYDPTNPAQQLLEDSYASDDTYKFRIAYSDGVTGKEFDGNVTQLGQGGEIDGMITQSVVIGLASDVTDVTP